MGLLKKKRYIGLPQLNIWSTPLKETQSLVSYCMSHIKPNCEDTIVLLSFSLLAVDFTEPIPPIIRTFYFLISLVESCWILLACLLTCYHTLERQKKSTWFSVGF